MIPLGTPIDQAGRMPATNSFRDLKVWRESMLLVEDVYRLSRLFPADERFGLTSQVRRAAVSIASNIAEGGRRKRRKAHLNHLDIALGSQAEVDVQLEIARRLMYIKDADHRTIVARIDRVGRMLNGLIESLQATDGDWKSVDGVVSD
jgi:four helix bundle protein